MKRMEKVKSPVKAEAGKNKRQIKKKTIATQLEWNGDLVWNNPSSPQTDALVEFQN